MLEICGINLFNSNSCLWPHGEIILLKKHLCFLFSCKFITIIFNEKYRWIKEIPRVFLIFQFFRPILKISIKINGFPYFFISWLSIDLEFVLKFSDNILVENDFLFNLRKNLFNFKWNLRIWIRDAISQDFIQMCKKVVCLDVVMNVLFNFKFIFPFAFLIHFFFSDLQWVEIPFNNFIQIFIIIIWCYFGKEPLNWVIVRVYSALLDAESRNAWIHCFCEVRNQKIIYSQDLASSKFQI